MKSTNEAYRGNQESRDDGTRGKSIDEHLRSTTILAMCSQMAAVKILQYELAKRYAGGEGDGSHPFTHNLDESSD